MIRYNSMWRGDKVKPTEVSLKDRDTESLSNVTVSNLSKLSINKFREKVSRSNMMVTGRRSALMSHALDISRSTDILSFPAWNVKIYA